MIIPAIDVQGGRVVQLVQGERLALDRGLEEMLETFAGFPWLQVIDLDAAKGEGANDALIRRCCRSGYRVRVGGGIRSRSRAETVLSWGAERIILGSSSFQADGTGVNTEFLGTLAPLGTDRLIVAVDSRNNHVAVSGWRRLLPLTAPEAVRLAQEHCGGFLYTYIDGEGLMQGTSLAAVRRLREITRLPLSVAGGIASMEEIHALDGLGCDAVLGMAIYTGKLPLSSLRAATITEISKP